MNILVITEQRDAKWNPVSFETLAAAQQIAAQPQSRLAAVVIGKGVRALAEELAAYQLAEVLLVEHDLLERYTPDGFTIALGQAIAQAKPDLVLLPHTYQVRDFAPKLAASLGKGMIGDCIGYRYENGRADFRAPDVSGQDGGRRDVFRRARRGSPRSRPARFAATRSLAARRPRRSRPSQWI